MKEEKQLKFSRSKVDLYLKCPCCFYLDQRCGVKQPSSAPFTLNNAVDTLLKKEFDIYREKRQPHPFVERMGISAIPFMHEDIEKWRNNRIGIQYIHPQTNFLLYGAVDDVWQLPSGELVIADYKTKATTGDITLEPKRKKNGDIIKTDSYLISYQKQIEFYQWLFKKNGFDVSKTAYFIFANAIKDRPTFDDCLTFEKHLISYEGDDSWVEPTIETISTYLQRETLPEQTDDCDYCKYRIGAQQIETYA